MRLKDKVAIVTGSSKGIGLGIARAFAREGAKVVITSRHPEEGEPIAQELGSKDGNAIYIRTDVTKPEDITNMIDTTIKTFGKLDILVNNAGYFIAKNAEMLSQEEFEFLHNTNLRSTFLCCKYALPHLKETRGNIINIGIRGLFTDQGGADRACKGHCDRLWQTRCARQCDLSGIHSYAAQ
jgi:meso-butanediol dehydrogenase/(S,S)-butanediol dehydrogenase/diacetyl reductase